MATKQMGTAQAKARARGPATLDHLKAKKPRVEVVRIALDDDVARAADEARQAVGRARLELMSATNRRAHEAEIELRKEDLKEAEQALEAAQDALAEVTVEMRFRSIGRAATDELERLHPPTEKDKAEVAKQRAENPDGEYPEPSVHDETFSPALVLASCFEPELTREVVGAMFGADPEPWRDDDPFVPDPDVEPWNYGELAQLVMAATLANTTNREVVLGKR